MRRLFLVALLLALAGTTQAIDIKGKWGLGVGVGSGTWGLSGSEASLIRGRTERTALILDLSIFQQYEEKRIDTTLQLDRLQRSGGITFGPRVRRYTRPGAKLSPYWDVFIHLLGTGSSYKSNSTESQYSAGGESGFAAGVEYFTPWHFTLAAHTGLFTASASRLWGRDFYAEYRGWRVNSSLGFSPKLQLRVYF